MVAVDPASLNVTGNFKITSKSVKFGEVAFVGSAHPVKHPSTNNWVDFFGSGGMIKEKTTISAYEMTGPNEPVSQLDMFFHQNPGFVTFRQHP